MVRVLFAVAFCLAVAALPTDGHALPWDTDMYDQPSVKPQERVETHPAGTVYRGKPYRPPGEVGTDGRTNPRPADASSITRGEEMAATYCMVCHGKQWRGDTPVARKFVTPPPIIGIVPQRSDGELFRRIRDGGAIMPAYGDKLTEEEMWDIVNYLRTLPEGDGE